MSHCKIWSCLCLSSHKINTKESGIFLKVLCTLLEEKGLDMMCQLVQPWPSAMEVTTYFLCGFKAHSTTQNSCLIPLTGPKEKKKACCLCHKEEPNIKHSNKLPTMFLSLYHKLVHLSPLTRESSFCSRL